MGSSKRPDGLGRRVLSYVCHACIEMCPAEPGAPLQGGTPLVSVDDKGIATT
jgi:hypothetical protein